MHAFITRRFLLLIFVLFGVSVLIFGILMTFSPERRAAAMIPFTSSIFAGSKKSLEAIWVGRWLRPSRSEKHFGAIFPLPWR
jgi:ABC-type dipeptide/oligopeptide/nickel transport system permease component